jgi:hypothetical protein
MERNAYRLVPSGPSTYKKVMHLRPKDACTDITLRHTGHFF